METPDIPWMLYPIGYLVTVGINCIFSESISDIQEKLEKRAIRKRPDLMSLFDEREELRTKSWDYKRMLDELGELEAYIEQYKIDKSKGKQINTDKLEKDIQYNKSYNQDNITYLETEIRTIDDKIKEAYKRDSTMLKIRARTQKFNFANNIFSVFIPGSFSLYPLLYFKKTPEFEVPYYGDVRT